MITNIIRQKLLKLQNYLKNPALQIEANAVLLGKMLTIKNNKYDKIRSLHDVEFKVFSQYGEDGIIQYLINKIPIPEKIFIEFGVEDYIESNTRFLLINNNWRGLVIDSSKRNINFIKNQRVSWLYDLSSVCEFITMDNINEIISKESIKGDIGLLSIDIDGNDYWIWKAINVISPRIVICEYNSIFGAEHAITVPYDAKFNKRQAHYSTLYFGASLPALCYLAREKGYDFIGSNSNGNNAFFIRSDIQHNIPKLTPKEGYVYCHFRDSRDKRGRRTYIRGDERLKLIAHMPVFNIETGEIQTIKNIFFK